MTTNPMQIWQFYDAPPELQALSENGGDEDWVIVAELGSVGNADVIADRLAIRDYEKHEHDGKVVFITNHA